jgi:hypothetical protein
MLRKWFYLAIVLCLVGCGEGGVTVKVHHIPRVQFEETFPGFSGYASWNEFQTDCTIYMMPMEEYNGIMDYHRILGHEMDHCLRGYFHEEQGE